MSSVLTQACFEKKKKKKIWRLSSFYHAPSLSPARAVPALPPWRGVWSKRCQISHTPGSAAPSWLGFCLSPCSCLHPPCTLVGLPLLLLVSTATPRDERHCSHPLSCSLAPPVSTLPDGRWLSFQRGCALKPGGLRSFVCSRAEEGVPRLGSRVAWQHISLSSDSHVPSQRLLMHTPQMTAILQQQLLPSLFTCYLWLLP